MDTVISTLTLLDTLQNSSYDPKNFCGASVVDLPDVDESVQRNLYIRFRYPRRRLCRRTSSTNLGRFDKTVKLLRFNNHILHTNDIDSFFKCFRCPRCDTFFKRSEFPNKHLLRYKDRVKQIYPKNVYKFRETLFEKLEGLNFPVSEDNKLLNNLSNFQF